MKKKDQIFDFYIDKSTPGKPLRVCLFCFNEWKNNDRRRLIDHMIGCKKAPSELKESLIRRDSQESKTKQEKEQRRQASQRMTIQQNSEAENRKRVSNWINASEEAEYPGGLLQASSDDEQSEEGRDAITLQEKKNLDRLMAKMIYQCELPVGVIEEPAFMAFIKSIRPAYYRSGLPKKAEIAAVIVRKSEDRVRKVRKQMGGVDFLGHQTRNQSTSFHRPEVGVNSQLSQEISDPQTSRNNVNRQENDDDDNNGVQSIPCSSPFFFPENRSVSL